MVADLVLIGQYRIVSLGDDQGEWVREHGYLEVHWEPFDDDVNRLTAEAMSGSGFAGRSRAWFVSQSVRDFAARLGEYPLDDAALPRLVSGSRPRGGDLLVQVGLSIYAVGGWGQVGIQVQLATEPWQSPVMRPQEHEAVALEIRTTYERLRQFGHDVEALIDGRQPNARIEGEHLI